MSRQRITATAKCRRDTRPDRDSVRADVSGKVKTALKAEHGDTLIFEEGCNAAHQRACLDDVYFIVRLRRAGLQGLEVVVEDGVVAEPVCLEPLTETVRKRLDGGA